jgi:hypothetical protein
LYILFRIRKHLKRKRKDFFDNNKTAELAVDFETTPNTASISFFRKADNNLSVAMAAPPPVSP